MNPAGTGSSASASGRLYVMFARLGIVLLVMSFLGACSPVAVLNQLFVPSHGWSLDSDIAYGSHPRQRLDVYTPDPVDAQLPDARYSAVQHSAVQHSAVQGAPVVVFFYGGSWRGGRRAYYRFVGQALAERGYVTVIPDYRVYPDVQFPEFIQDGAQAVVWVERNIASLGGDPERLVLMGHSAGAHIAAMLAVDDTYLPAAGLARSAISAFVGLAGPYAIDPLRYRSTRPIFAPGTDSTIMPEVAPGTQVPPMLLLHGSADGTVDPRNAYALAARVESADGVAEVVELEGVGHIGIILQMAAPFRRTGGVLDLADAFILQHVASPPMSVGAAVRSPTGAWAGVHDHQTRSGGRLP